ncbi:branched-chain amino acid aminotransferase [Embleya sp. NBC_00896]|uniref:branched-chain amino acid aminotransferase n=1 Tax=Embleya sp. NBC_00896 TaxID=2975961 RepID=UPI002F911D82|nr:branched-chain amino acid aminotransferase [Embleya sp. NBC_00896]
MSTPAVEFAVRPSTRPLPAEQRDAILAAPGFGRSFTDHMVTIKWTAEHGWHDAEVRPYASIPLDPANMTLHYGQSIFEGLKAYRRPDGTVALFRPDANAARFRRSAARLAMPELPVELFVEACARLVRQDLAWVPQGGETSLYLRPFMFATEVALGVRPASEYLFVVIASPAGPYFTGGVEPVSVWLSQEYVRAAPGGTGEAKCAGNYAASLSAQAEAARHGCDQVVWLDATERRWVEEMGGMNLFFVWGSGDDATLVTPELTGTLLPGITRDSLLRLAGDLGHRTEERRVSVAEWRANAADGTLSEVFACGTAAVVTPVGEVRSAQGDWTVSGGSTGKVTMRLREALLDIQTGRAADPYGWVHTVA